MRRMKKAFAVAAACGLCAAAVLTGCQKKEREVVIYTNADDEAIEAMKGALDGGGYEGKYILQSFGTSELGGKLLAEGANIEADMVTMSSFYLDSAQETNHMFQDLTFETKSLAEYPAFYTPITAQEGTILVNTQVLKENNLPMPTCIRDLADPAYAGLVSVTDVKSSSTAWLLIQALVSAYGEEGAEEVLAGIYENAGDHIESSGSAPLKKVRAGEGQFFPDRICGCDRQGGEEQPAGDGDGGVHHQKRQAGVAENLPPGSVRGRERRFRKQVRLPHGVPGEADGAAVGKTPADFGDRKGGSAVGNLRAGAPPRLPGNRYKTSGDGPLMSRITKYYEARNRSI